MRIFSFFVIAMLAFSAPFPSESASGAEAGIEVAQGLTIRQVADDDLIPDCTTIAVDRAGNVVASGPGYIRMLMDDDGDGRFDRYTTLVDGPDHGAHGLCFDDASLFYVGDDGVWQVTDTDRDGVVDSTPNRVLAIKTGGEHDARMRFAKVPMVAGT